MEKIQNFFKTIENSKTHEAWEYTYPKYHILEKTTPRDRVITERTTKEQYTLAEKIFCDILDIFEINNEMLSVAPADMRYFFAFDGKLDKLLEVKNPTQTFFDWCEDIKNLCSVRYVITRTSEGKEFLLDLITDEWIHGSRKRELLKIANWKSLHIKFLFVLLSEDYKIIKEIPSEINILADELLCYTVDKPAFLYIHSFDDEMKLIFSYELKRFIHDLDLIDEIIFRVERNNF